MTNLEVYERQLHHRLQVLRDEISSTQTELSRVGELLVEEREKNQAAFPGLERKPNCWIGF